MGENEVCVKARRRDFFLDKFLSKGKNEANAVLLLERTKTKKKNLNHMNIYENISVRMNCV
jgi:hypothetical protein